MVWSVSLELNNTSNPAASEYILEKLKDVDFVIISKHVAGLTSLKYSLKSGLFSIVTNGISEIFTFSI